ncbi:MAG: hypothetical protein ACOCUR_00425 [Nanoarchaeota archaeon]
MLFFVILTSLSVFSSGLYIEVKDLDVTSIVPFSYNGYYRDVFYFGRDLSSDTGTDIQNNQISINPSPNTTSIFFFEDIDYGQDYTLSINGGDDEISFCNNNGICEPCSEGLCNNIENHLTCPDDCSSGDKDNYCDLQRDGVCDPDCVHYDFDCEECIDNVCIYEGIKKERVECGSLGGSFCEFDKSCSGVRTYSDDLEMECCIGDCLSSKETEPAEEKTPEIQEDAYEDDSEFEFYIYIGIIIFFILISVVVVVYFESKEVINEHKVRQYVYNLVKSGYSYDQIYSALVQQSIEKNIIDKVMKKMRK